MRRSGSGHLQRAAELFVIDEWGSDSAFVQKAWRSHSEPEPFFISIAASQWQIVVTTQRDRTQLTVRGPETRATVTAIHVGGVSTRTLQRRVARATGLTRSTIRQITRAEQAVELLGCGGSPPDVALRLGYSDQAHLTRSLQRFIGQTPGRLVSSSRAG